MKNLIILILISITLPSIAQQKKVHCIHGLGGSSSSWNGFASTYYSQRQITSYSNNSYSTNNGVSSMATEIQNKIGTTKETNTIAIAHSMGGVATRHIDVNNTGRFSGVILFGAPLRGTKGANSLNNSVGASYVSNATFKLTRGPVSGIFGPVTVFLLNQTMNVSDWVGRIAMTNIKDKLGMGTSNTTTNDLALDSPYNQQFYTKSTVTPKFILWGSENSPAHMRFAAGFMDAGNEEKWVSNYNLVTNAYAANRDYCNIKKWLSPLTFLLFDWRASQWDIGYKYLANESEAEWANVVGAGYTQAYTSTYYQYTLNDGYAAYNNCVSAANGDSYRINMCYTTYFKPVSVTSYTWVKDAYDGLVSRYSATGQGTTWVNNADIRQLPGNNHQEMRWSPESQFELGEAFKGNRAGGAMTIAAR